MSPNVKRVHQVLCLLLFTLVSACATTSGPKSAPEAASVLDQVKPRGSILIAAQPTEADLRSLKDRGISHVINLRSVEEMTALGIDESDLVAAQGIHYEHLPIAASSDYQPAVLTALQQAVDASDGSVLVHCASGGRAALLYAAYAMQHEGLSPDQAMRTLEPVGAWPLALERLTGRHLKVVFADSEP